jgi:rod shape determining protein RodA
MILTAVDYRRFYSISPYLYVGILLLLMYTVFFGRYVQGARRGIGIGAFSFQPAEFSKIITILFLARYLDSTKRNPGGILRFIIACTIVLIPMGIVVLQPDLGTALVFIPILLAMLFISGFSLRYIMFIILLVASTILLTLLPYWEQIILKSSRPLLTLLFSFRFVSLCSIVLLVIL